MFALTCAEAEQELAAVPVSAFALASSHNSAACQKQVQTAVKMMWNRVAGNEEMQQHLVSHLGRTGGTLAGIQASHQTGHGAGCGLRKVRAQQDSNAASSQSAEHFSKPKPTRAKVGPRQQMKFAAK